LTGDAGFEAENSILAYGYDLKSDILKVGHHGSSSASSPTFLSKVRPAISVIEVGAGNDYGHPAQTTLDALQQIGSKICRTDLNGNIIITTDGVTYSVTTQRQSGNAANISTQPQNPVATPSLGPITFTSRASQQFVGLQNLTNIIIRAADWPRKSNLQMRSGSPAQRMPEPRDMCHARYAIHLEE